MKIFITGGNGFIGHHVAVQAIAAGHAVTVHRHEEADVRDAYAITVAVENAAPDAVIHLAAITPSADPARMAEVNIVGLLNTLAACRLAGVSRFVFASSGGAIYGSVDHPVSEEHPLRPQSAYGLSKLAGEQYLEWFARQHGITAVSLRLGNVYGPGQTTGVHAEFERRMERGNTIHIHGDGTQVRDYVHATDVASAFVASLTAHLTNPFTAINIGTGIGTTVNDIVGRLRWSRKWPAVSEVEYHASRPGEIQSSLLACGKASRLLGWNHHTRLFSRPGLT